MKNRINTSSGQGRFQLSLLLAIMILGLAVRLYCINAPMVESHQTRQAQTAMMARNIYEDHMNIFRSRLDFFGNVPGYIVLEFPLMHGITALLYYLFGVHEIIGRIVSILFSMGAMLLMYGLARKFLAISGSIAALALYVFSPMNIFFSRAFMPESSMLFFSIGAVYFFLEWLDKRTAGMYLAAVVFAALACLIKPVAGLIYAPIIAAWFLKDGRNLPRRFDFWLYIFLTIMPLVIWGAYANYFNSKQTYIPAGFGGNWMELIRTRGMTEHWFSPHFYKFVGGSIIILLLTPIGFIGTVAGIIRVWACDRRVILYSWLGAMIIYFYVLAGVHTGHIYYSLPLLPLAAIFIGYAYEWLFIERRIPDMILKRRPAVWLGIIAVFLTLACYIAGYYSYFKYMYGNRMPYTLEAAKIISMSTPSDKCIVVCEPGLVQSVFSYYAHRNVFPFYIGSATAVSDLENLRNLGAAAFVALDSKYGTIVKFVRGNKAFWRHINEKYRPVAITDHYIIFDLTKSNKGGNE